MKCLWVHLSYANQPVQSPHPNPLHHQAFTLWVTIPLPWSSQVQLGDNQVCPRSCWSSLAWISPSYVLLHLSHGKDNKASCSYFSLTPSASWAILVLPRVALPLVFPGSMSLHFFLMTVTSMSACLIRLLWNESQVSLKTPLLSPKAASCHAIVFMPWKLLFDFFCCMKHFRKL